MQVGKLTRNNAHDAKKPKTSRQENPDFWKGDCG